MGDAASDRCLIGATSISIAVMNDAKVPTVIPLVALCHKAMQITADKAVAASIWVSGVIAEPAMVAFMARRRSSWLKRSKRSACAACASCRRTARWASTFSSTT